MALGPPSHLPASVKQPYACSVSGRAWSPAGLGFLQPELLGLSPPESPWVNSMSCAPRVLKAPPSTLQITHQPLLFLRPRLKWHPSEELP